MKRVRLGSLEPLVRFCDTAAIEYVTTSEGDARTVRVLQVSAGPACGRVVALARALEVTPRGRL